ncbi:AtpZ/AtpI family protein [Fibrella sp. HMF5335]|uniref:AtpZ/AtpI family protein n=1 Tax=Fibrella rubiginis TaxID=2817060 RepID=A0A939GCR7_9BACT|nr:AtpZ/AtpI family protein [Fibrella rubiginis]MBO0935150.1 AtpZ/AtpI family protein [Fibrella rubiginis]
MNDAPNPDQRPDEDPNIDRRPSAYAQYSSIAFQMLATIGLGVYAGMKLDQWQGNKTPGWTIGLSLTAIFASLYLFIRQLPKN